MMKELLKACARRKAYFVQPGLRAVAADARAAAPARLSAVGGGAIGAHAEQDGWPRGAPAIAGRPGTPKSNGQIDVTDADG